MKTLTVPGEQNDTIEFIRRKMCQNSDFPALSESLVKITNLVQEDRKAYKQFAKVIMEDYALTSKILKIVNSVYYMRSGSQVKSISHAIGLLGIDRIKAVAVSLLLIDHLANKDKAKKLHSHMLMSLYSGMFAKNLAVKLSIKKKEEVFIGGIFHHLGKLLSIYYIHESFLDIEHLIQEQNFSEEEASLEILGITYSELGINIARDWTLPNYIIDTIPAIELTAQQSPLNLNAKIHAIICLSNDLTDVIERSDEETWRENSVKLWRNYTDLLNLDDKDLIPLADKTKEDLVILNQDLNIKFEDSPLINNINSEEEPSLESDPTLKLSTVEDMIDDDIEPTESYDSTVKLPVQPSASEVENTIEKPLEDAIRQSVETESGQEKKGTLTFQEKQEAEKKVQPAINENELENDRIALLKKGMDDISVLLEKQHTLLEVYRLVMDVIIKAFKPDHSVVCFYDPLTEEFEAKLSSGLSHSIIQEFRFPNLEQANFFNLALQEDVELLIPNCKNKKILNKIPAWYQQLRIPAETFFLLPIRKKGKPIALFYFDKRKSGEIHLSNEELTLLKELKQRCPAISN